jgi:septum formation protein
VLVLASASPRRHELLGWLGVPYAVDAPDVDEEPSPGERPADLVRRLACAKAVAVAARRTGDWVLGADTAVEVDGRALGKPADRAEAADMLARLAGREHRVLTALALVAPGRRLRAERLVESRVRFRALSRAAIAAYVTTGEPDDKAGAYAIQGRGAGLIAGVEGSFTNVMGLPLEQVERVLEEAGLLGR